MKTVVKKRKTRKIMSKKITGIIIAVVVLCAVGIGTFFLLTNKDLEKENQIY